MPPSPKNLAPSDQRKRDREKQKYEKNREARRAQARVRTARKRLEKSIACHEANKEYSRHVQHHSSSRKKEIAARLSGLRFELTQVKKSRLYLQHVLRVVSEVDPLFSNVEAEIQELANDIQRAERDLRFHEERVKSAQAAYILDENGILADLKKLEHLTEKENANLPSGSGSRSSLRRSSQREFLVFPDPVLERMAEPRTDEEGMARQKKTLRQNPRAEASQQDSSDEIDRYRQPSIPIATTEEEDNEQEDN